MTGRVILFVAGIVVAVPVAIAASLFVPSRLPNGTATPVLVTVAAGATPTAIGKQLAAAHLIGSPTLFRVAVKLRGGGDQILAGDYAFPHAFSTWSAVGAVESEKYRYEPKVTIPEGFTREQIADRLDAAGIVSRADFLAVTANPTAGLRALVPSLPAGATLEGYLFPATYNFLTNSSATTVAKRFLEAFATNRASLPTATGSAAGHSLNQVVILASIVEREVKTAGDRAKVADLFWRRLAAGMPLQSDVTVAYAVGKSATALSATDFQSTSLYNTYVHPGLPAGPIGNPGVESLTATLNPTPNSYLYFITNPADGSAIFATTLAEQNANQAKYLK